MSINLQVTVLGTIFLVLAASCRSTAAFSIFLDDPCTVTDFPALCRGTIKGLRNVNAATDVAIGELMKRTRQARYIAKKEMKVLDGGVSTCLSNFNSAFDNLDKALKNIKEGDRFSLNINLSAALTDYDTCSETMKGARGDNVVYKSAGVLYKMADNCLALSTLVKP
ncbi:Plant invertase/pectin methylesterase inhibitor superfamily protein [Raphanus sativus]|uniref:Uncharacterized protein LOC108818957 n=1 Tax=Raphanus sativus TaxID=3726 RepID=A0A6J0KHI8_RAPSA|nr:uncharacterized protein LOC108818957 [Raphanus sativus]KAJ4879675.1 Plant invertase/pectin methylesterase inhibitor superfamily protein [Raphanus sativus]